MGLNSPGVMARNAFTFKMLHVAGDYGQMIDTGCRGYEVVGPTISCTGANAAPFNGNFSGYWQDTFPVEIEYGIEPRSELIGKHGVFDFLLTYSPSYFTDSQSR